MHAALIFIPIFIYILLVIICAGRIAFREIIEGLVKGHLILFTFIAVTTEVLSFVDGICFDNVICAWILLLFVCIFLFILTIKRRNRLIHLSNVKGEMPITDIFTGSVIVILVATLLTGLLYPPNTCDSMTYHMSRIMHWIVNRNVSFYPTSITRQNYLAPLAEFAIMHLQILTNCDLYANLVQWASFVVIIGLAILIAAEFGMGSNQQVMSGVVVATMPMAILQASSTQNDVVVSSFVVSFALFMLRLRDNPNPESTLFAAMALGLAVLTKGTAYFYCSAIGASLAVPVLLTARTEPARLVKALAAFFGIMAFALLLNVGHLSRNYGQYGNPFSTGGLAIQNEDISARTLFINTVKNGALHFGTQFIELDYYFFIMLQEVLGPSLNDPRITWGGAPFQIPFSRHENTAGNIFQMYIGLISLISLPILWIQGHYRRIMWYYFGILGGGALYCLMLKWQPWASRLHTPLFALSAPLLIIALGTTKKRLQYYIMIFMVLYSFQFAFDNATRSLISMDWYNYSRSKLYFMDRVSHFRDYDNAMNILTTSNVISIGLCMDGNDWEYPFWAMLRYAEKHNNIITLRQLCMDDGPPILVLPSLLVATKRIDDWEYANRYLCTYTSKYVSVFALSCRAP